MSNDDNTQDQTGNEENTPNTEGSLFDQTNDQQSEAEVKAAAEKQEWDLLFKRAEMMGLKPKRNWKLETLRDKVAAAQTKAPDAEPAEVTEEEADVIEQTLAQPGTPIAPTPAVRNAKMTRQQFLQMERRKANQLVRCVVQSMDPNKKEYQGEIFSVSNAAVGTVKKFIMYNTEYHVPRIILNMLRDKKCLIFVTKRDERGNRKREGKTIPAYNIVELPPLTDEELRQIATRQAAQRSLESDNLGR